MTYDFSNPELFNQVYIPLFYENKRIRILYGSRDSGKSDFVAEHTIMSMLEQDFFRMILMRKYYASIRQTQFQTLLDYINFWELHDLFHITTNPLTITCKENNNQILARGLDQPDNTKSIKDPTALWMEEADQISEEAYIESSLSLRTSRNVNLIEWLTFNPRRASSWINRLFFPPKNTYEKEDGDFTWVPSINSDAVILHTTYKHNRFCTPQRIKRLEDLKLQDDNHYRVNALGLWGGALKGLIYPNWSICDSLPHDGDDVFGLDYGFNNPTALVHVSFKKPRNLYIKELLYITNHNHSQLISLMVSQFKEYIGRKLIIVDSEEPALITALRLAGFNAIPAIKGPDSVYNGIMLVKQFELFITNDSTNIQTEAEEYIWKSDKDGKTFDEPVKFSDHAWDAVRYTVQTYGKFHWLKENNQSPYREPRIKKERIKHKYYN